VLGAAWALIQPLFNMLVFTVLFGRLAGLDSRTGGIPYPVFSLAALVPWTYFATTLATASNSLVQNANMISKIYFPRLLIPAAAVLSGLVDYLISLTFLGVLLPFYYPQVVPSWSALVMVPILTLLVTTLALGVSLWLSALNVQYRDIRYTVPFLVQLWMFVTPVVYPLSLVPEQYRWLAALNPTDGIIEGFRSCLLGQPWDYFALGTSVVFSTAILVSGCFYFRRLERSFADVI
jgi:lipopolysaccharide transport system permease protein